MPKEPLAEYPRATARYDELLDAPLAPRARWQPLAAPHPELRVRATWEEAREHARRPAAAFLHESPHVETWRELAQFAAPSVPARRSALEGAVDLGHRMHTDFEFDRKATSVSTPLREVMKKRRGVCQDFAHLMIGADASRAWVSVYCGEGGGWVDLDPTNDCVVDDEHVTLGWGRDFGAVTPIAE
ncbi:MAG: transglutaminase family protein [Burkholderiales bacterium]